MSFELRLCLMVEMAFGRDVREQVGHVRESRNIRADAAEEWDLTIGRVGCTIACRHRGSHVLE